MCSFDILSWCLDGELKHLMHKLKSNWTKFGLPAIQNQPFLVDEVNELTPSPFVKNFLKLDCVHSHWEEDSDSSPQFPYFKAISELKGNLKTVTVPLNIGLNTIYLYMKA